VKSRLVQYFSICVALATAHAADLQPGAFCRSVLTDVDQRQVSVTDGRVSLVTIVTRANEHDARVVGNRVPQQDYADPNLRFVTILNLGPHPTLHGIFSVFIRRRLELEVQRLQPIYRAKGSSRDPRQDLFIVTDFDGSAVSQFGTSPDAKKTSVFVLAGDGRVVAHWNGLPPSEDLAAALEGARGARVRNQ
jgi:hypothetical protein